MSHVRQHLEETDRLLAESKARINQQKQAVADLETAAAKAKAILREFEDTQLLIVSHREALIRELAQIPWFRRHLRCWKGMGSGELRRDHTSSRRLNVTSSGWHGRGLARRRRRILRLLRLHARSQLNKLAIR